MTAGRPRRRAAQPSAAARSRTTAMSRTTGACSIRPSITGSREAKSPEAAPPGSVRLRNGGLDDLELPLDRGQLLCRALDLGALEPVLRRGEVPDGRPAEHD